MQLRSYPFVAMAVLLVAVSLQQKDSVVITELIYVDSNGEVVSRAYTTTTLPAPAPTPAATQNQAGTEIPSKETGEGPIASTAVTAQDMNNKDTTSDYFILTNVATGVASYIEAQAGNAVRSRTGFVHPNDPLFIRMALFHTNAHRANSSVPALKWNQTLARKAQVWVNLCSGDEERGRPAGTGVNAAWSSSGDFNPSDFISDLWYNGEFNHYPWNQGNNVDTSGPAFVGFGHLSQLLWSTSTSFGCSIKNNCPGPWKSHALCYYAPPGNYPGEFSKVKRPGHGPVLRGNGK